MDKQALLSITRALLECPTAPFHEHAVAAKICERLTALPHVRIELDAFGNVIATYRRGRALTRFAFAAHMDHPGWVRDSAAVRAAAPRAPVQDGMRFLGGVPADWFHNVKPRRNYGKFAMWDLPECEVREGRIFSRACDDLTGCAAIVAMMEELEACGDECGCIGLFSRAEEVGFLGALRLASSGRIPKSATVISLEASAERPPAVIGNGPILRVGDRTSVFDSQATALLATVAADARITVQRCLMPGGTCEATVYQLYGYRTAGLAVALGNYHNCGPEYQIEPEFVSTNDLLALARLCTAIARDTRKPGSIESALRKKLEAGARTWGLR
jgi:putative aminopeptidase FrvX